MNERKSRILIVDDERTNIQVLNAILQEHYDISVALNGEQALKRAFAEKKPDLILLDIQMPDMDGFEVCRRLQEHPDTRDIPSIFITASASEKDEERGLAVGAVDYISKPFGPAVILARVRVHLELKRKRDIFRTLSSKDGLTCIANRRRFEEFYDMGWRNCLRSGSPISVIMADIDHFKLYNDHYGHAAGDDCLREVAEILAARVSRHTDLVARYGGEEFVCVLLDTDQPGAMFVAQKMLEAIRKAGIPHAFSPVASTVTLSLGVAGITPRMDGMTPQDLFLAADKALYEAKDGGRNRAATRMTILPEENRPAARDKESGDTRQRILMVDDEPINLSVLNAIFENTYVTVGATSGGQALELARREPRPDIILLDIQMPDMDGYAVYQTLREDARTRDIPVLFITVLSQKTDEAKCLKMGAVDYIPKPFDPSVVLARVRTHLTLRRTLADLARRNELLEDALSMRDSVERIVRNDLKQPLLNILTLSGGFAATPDLPAIYAEEVREIERAGFDLLGMIATSIDLWKLERGVYQITPRPVDLAGITRTVIRNIASSREAARVEIHTRFQDRPVTDQDHFVVQGEELLCYSLLFNLIQNAVEASPPDRAVTIDLEPEGVRKVRVANHGAVPLEIRSRFMEKGVTWGKKDGRGLGAYAARLMAESLGATLGLEIDDERNHTEIRLDFP